MGNTVEPFHGKSPSTLWVVRLYDYYDHCWSDMTKAVSYDEALDVWNKETAHGTKFTCYSDGSYFAIYPASTPAGGERTRYDVDHSG